MFQQQIACPVCKTPIQFDTKQLLAGVQFTCHNCHSSIGLSLESKPMVEEAMKKFEELKQSTSQLRK